MCQQHEVKNKNPFLVKLDNFQNKNVNKVNIEEKRAEKEYELHHLMCNHHSNTSINYFLLIVSQILSLKGYDKQIFFCQPGTGPQGTESARPLTTDSSDSSILSSKLLSFSAHSIFTVCF